MKDVPKQADELTVDEACKRFKVTLSQLADATLHARHLTLKQSSELGVSRGRVRLYKASTDPRTAAHSSASKHLAHRPYRLQEADVKALAAELKLLRKAAKKRKQATADSEQPEWYDRRLSSWFRLTTLQCI